jgi:hypothetical protein
MTNKKDEYLDINDMLPDKFVCRDIFLYPGYNIGDPCPKCKGYPNPTKDPDFPPKVCNCYNDALERFRKDTD